MITPKFVTLKDVVPDEHILHDSRDRRGEFSASLHRLPPFATPGEVVFPEHLINLNVGEAHRLEQAQDAHRSEASFVGGESIVTPSGCPLSQRWHGRADTINVWFAPRFVRSVTESLELDPARAEIVPVFRTRDPKIERIGLLLGDELGTGGLGGELCAEGLANALTVHLLREHSSLGRRAKRKAERESGGGLSGRQLKQALDFIGDNLSTGDLSLERLAASANLSPYHFFRLFKESTGLSPHRYVIQQRVEKAKALLTGTDLTVGEVARSCGFSNQGHLNLHFKRAFGVAPGAFRRG